MKIKQWLIVLVLFFTVGTNSSYSADCIKLTKQRLYDSKTSIFIGEIMDSLSIGCRTVLVHEQFKGVVSDTVIVKFGYSDYHLKNRSLWLVYANDLANNDTLMVETCSGSKSYKYPYSVHDDTPYGIPLEIKSREGVSQAELILDNRSYMELYTDILNLRQLKMNQELADSRKSIDTLKSLNGNLADRLKESDKYHKVVLGVLALLVVLQIIFGIRNHSSSQDRGD